MEVNSTISCHTFFSAFVCYTTLSTIVLAQRTLAGEPVDAFSKECALVAPYSYREPNLGGMAARDSLLEAAAVYCRERKLNFRDALPAITQEHSVIYAGYTPMLVEDEAQDWIVVYRDNGQADGKAMWLTAVVVGHKPKPARSGKARPHIPKTISLTLPGFPSTQTVAWFEGAGKEGFPSDCAIVVFTQGRPFATTDPWYFQRVAKYRIRSSGFKKLWDESTQLHAVNFVPTHEIIQYSQNGFRPTVLRAMPKVGK